MSAPVLPPVGPDLRVWGKNLTAFLRRYMDRIRYKKAGDNPSEDGVFLWDGENGYPVVSLNGEFRQLIIANGYAQFTQDDDVTAAAADTAYSITYDTPSFADSVSLDGTNPERIVFEEGGIFLLSFTAQISSTSGSTVMFRFWPAINGRHRQDRQLLQNCTRMTPAPLSAGRHCFRLARVIIWRCAGLLTALKDICTRNLPRPMRRRHRRQLWL